MTQRYELEQLQLVRDGEGRGKAGKVRICKAPNGKFVAVKQFARGREHEAEKEHDLLKLLATKSIRGSVVDCYGVVPDGDASSILLEALVPEAGWVPFDQATIERPIPDCLALVARLAEAMAGLHQAGFVHGDLQDYHIFAHGTEVKLIDFSEGGQATDKNKLRLDQQRVGLIMSDTFQALAQRLEQWTKSQGFPPDVERRLLEQAAPLLTLLREAPRLEPDGEPRTTVEWGKQVARLRGAPETAEALNGLHRAILDACDPDSDRIIDCEALFQRYVKQRDVERAIWSLLRAAGSDHPDRRRALAKRAHDALYKQQQPAEPLDLVAVLETYKAGDFRQVQDALSTRSPGPLGRALLALWAADAAPALVLTPSRPGATRPDGRASPMSEPGVGQGSTPPSAPAGPGAAPNAGVHEPDAHSSEPLADDLSRWPEGARFDVYERFLSRLASGDVLTASMLLQPLALSAPRGITPFEHHLDTLLASKKPVAVLTEGLALARPDETGGNAVARLREAHRAVLSLHIDDAINALQAFVNGPGCEARFHDLAPLAGEALGRLTEARKQLLEARNTLSRNDQSAVAELGAAYLTLRLQRMGWSSQTPEGVALHVELGAFQAAQAALDRFLETSLLPAGPGVLFGDSVAQFMAAVSKDTGVWEGGERGEAQRIAKGCEELADGWLSKDGAGYEASGRPLLNMVQALGTAMDKAAGRQYRQARDSVKAAMDAAAKVPAQSSAYDTMLRDPFERMEQKRKDRVEQLFTQAKAAWREKRTEEALELVRQGKNQDVDPEGRSSKEWDTDGWSRQAAREAFDAAEKEFYDALSRDPADLAVENKVAGIRQIIESCEEHAQKSSGTGGDSHQRLDASRLEYMRSVLGALEPLVRAARTAQADVERGKQGEKGAAAGRTSLTGEAKGREDDSPPGTAIQWLEGLMVSWDPDRCVRYCWYLQELFSSSDTERQLRDVLRQRLNPEAPSMLVPAFCKLMLLADTVYKHDKTYEPYVHRLISTTLETLNEHGRKRQKVLRGRVRQANEPGGEVGSALLTFTQFFSSMAGSHRSKDPTKPVWAGMRRALDSMRRTGVQSPTANTGDGTAHAVRRVLDLMRARVMQGSELVEGQARSKGSSGVGSRSEGSDGQLRDGETPPSGPRPRVSRWAVWAFVVLAAVGGMSISSLLAWKGLFPLHPAPTPSFGVSDDPCVPVLDASASQVRLKYPSNGNELRRHKDPGSLMPWALQWDLIPTAKTYQVQILSVGSETSAGHVQWNCQPYAPQANDQTGTYSPGELDPGEHLWRVLGLDVNKRVVAVSDMWRFSVKP